MEASEEHAGQNSQVWRMKVYEGSARVEAKDAYEAELAGMAKAISAVVCLAHRIYRFCDAAILR